ncbi:MAG: ABC transporter permease [Gemmatimonadaceae bacterium]|nr:ABC transporter permease [Gemmatimonadaceae bacterium]
MRNIKLAVRTLLKTPFVSAIAILSLALGIGANAAIYSMFDQVLMRKLPVPEPGQLVNLSAPGPMPGSTSCNQAGNCDIIFSYAMFRDLEKAQTSFTGIAAHRSFSVSLGVRNEPVTGDGMMVSGSYFPVLGIQPAKGRLLRPDDDQVIGANFVAVLAYSFWEDAFGLDPNIIGQAMVINGKSYNIVGVAPQGFDGTTIGNKPKVFVPITMRGEVQRFSRWEDRRVYWLYVFARLKPGVGIDAARASINAVYSPILTDIEGPLQEGMSDKTMASFKNKKVLLEPGARGQSSMHREAKTPILLLFSVTAIVLLIACANIANLLLARGAGRATEMGVRLALGATRRHLVTQLLTESVLLAFVGGVASLFVAQWTLSLMMSIMPPDASDTFSFSISPTVIAFSGLLSVATGLAFGLFPALHSTRSDLISAIRAGAGQLTGGRAAARFRASLVTVQISLSMGLLIMSALFLKSLMNVSRVNLGVTVDGISTFLVVPRRAGYDSARTVVLLTQVERELKALPGVSHVTGGMVPLMSGDNWGNSVKVQGYDCGPDVDCGSRFNEIGTDYFKTFGVALRAGREFTEADVVGAQRVAIINEAFAKKFNLGTDPVGKFMGEGGPPLPGGGANDSLNIQIIGLVPNVKYSDVKDSVPPVYYRPWRQDPNVAALYYYVRSAVPPEQMLGTLRTVIKRIDPNLPVEELKTMEQQVKENVFLDRMISVLSSAFALLATVLAGVGLYGVLSYSVAQRTREIGVRMALGADSANVRGLVLRQVGWMVVIGGVVGIGFALGAGRAARSLLFELQGHDPLSFTIAVVLLAVIALGAGWIPARRAAMTDPMHALRYD